jgi:hypothetical protein
VTPTPAPEPEALPAGRIALALLATLAVAGLSAGLARAWQVHATPRFKADAPEASRAEVSGVFQRPFALETGAAAARAAQLERLNNYGWVDRTHDVIHLPIERAFEAVLGQQEHEEPER